MQSISSSKCFVSHKHLLNRLLLSPKPQLLSLNHNIESGFNVANQYHVNKKQNRGFLKPQIHSGNTFFISVPHVARSDPTRSSLVAEANIRLKDQK
ncbi:hypothetical protein YC2023_015975 [Brassica napus]